MKKLIPVLLALACVSAFAQTNNARMLSGVNYQTGTTYTFVAIDATRVTSFANAAAVAATLPSGQTVGFGAGTDFAIVNKGSGIATITCTNCTINGAGTLQLVANQSADLYSDGTNYVAAVTSAGSGSVPVGVANGSALVSNGVGNPPAYQTKSVYDVRDFGVVGDGSTNDTTAFQNAITAACGSNVGSSAGSMLTIPRTFQIKVISTINVNSCGGFILDGQSGTGQAGYGAQVVWAGGNGGTVFSVNRTRDSIFRNFGVTALNGSNLYNICFDLDENAGSGILSHDLYENIQCGGFPGGTQNANFAGVRIGQNAPGNTEQQVFRNFNVSCGSGVITNTSNGRGFLINPTANGAQPFYVSILSSEISGCSHGVEIAHNTRQVIIDGGNWGPNFNSLYLINGTGAVFENITTTLDVSSSIYLNGWAGVLEVRNNSFTGGGAAAIDVTNASGGAKILVEDNDFGGVPMLNGTFTPGSATGFMNVIGNGNFTGCPIQGTSGITFGALLYNSPTSGNCDNVFASRLGVVLQTFTFANLPAGVTNGTLVFCSDCKNVTDDTTGTFDSVAASGGHGTNVLRENGAWRAH